MTFELHHGDCLSILPHMKDAGFDAVVTDPPLAFGHDSFPGTAGGWRDWYEDGASVRLLARLLGDAVKPGAVAVVFFDSRTMISCGQVFKDVGWRFLRLLSIGREGRREYMGWQDGTDFAAVFSWLREPRFYGPLALDHYDAEITPTTHPVGKSRFALEHIVQNVTPEGGVVLDPFMGAGPVGAACTSTGRGFVGIESDAHWFGVAENLYPDGKVLGQ